MWAFSNLGGVELNDEDISIILENNLLDEESCEIQLSTLHENKLIKSLPHIHTLHVSKTYFYEATSQMD
jgi:hypothetical protein